MPPYTLFLLIKPRKAIPYIKNSIREGPKVKWKWDAWVKGISGMARKCIIRILSILSEKPGNSKTQGVKP